MLGPRTASLLVVAVLQGRGAEAGAAPAGDELDAPVTAVTVYGDRARVTRTATVTLQGRRTVVFPVLAAPLDPGTLRLESPDAQVETFEILPVAEDDLPVGEVKRVLDALERIDDRAAQLQRDLDVWRDADLGTRLRPAPPALDGLRAPARVDGRGWGAVLAFARTFGERVEGKVRDLEREQQELARQRWPLVKRAHELGLGGRRGGYRVRVRVEGHGRARLHLSAMSPQARWQPVYDIRFDPREQQVTVYFAALVAQESGEDWVDARLTVSTAAPATATTWPRLPVWKIGERERFIPTPRAIARPLPPPPPAVPPVEGAETAAALRARLRHDLIARVSGAAPNEDPLSAVVGGRASSSTTRAPDKTQEHWSPPPRPSAMPPPPPPAPPRRDEERSEPADVAEVAQVATVASTGSRSRTASAPVESFGLRPPGLRGDVAPSASFSGGYDLVYHAAAPETVRSGKGTRRVALFARSFPVQVERRIYPALSDDTYLVGLMRNPLAQPLPEGDARLFVGQDPAGTAHLGLVGAGQTAMLPLGIDAAVKVVRHVDVETRETGLLSKDEVSTYRVTVELANPYPSPLSVRLVEQLPLPQDDHVKVTRLGAEPRPFEARDADGLQLAQKGGVEWRLVVPARARQVVQLVYSLERPKGYRLRQ